MGTKVYDNYEDLITFNRNSKGTALRPIGYGDELVTNGTFDTDSDWTKTGATAIAGGVATMDGTSGTGLLYQGILTLGKTYYYSFTISSITGTLLVINNDGTTLESYTTTGTKTLSWTHGIANGNFLFRVSTGSNTATIYNISVKEVLFDREGDPLTLFLHPEGVPRIEYDADRNLKGLLIEPDGKNLVDYSNLDTSGAWNSNGFTVTQNATLSPDGLNNGTKLELASLSRNFRGNFITSATSTTVTYSFWIKKGSGATHLNAFIIRNDSAFPFNQEGSINLDTGEIIRNQFGSGNMIVEPYPNGWFRIKATRDTGISLGDQIRIYPPYVNSSGTAEIGQYNYSFGHQLEYGPIATSYMPTTGSPFTRGKDEANMTNVSGLIGQKEGTVYVEADWRLTAGTNQWLLSVSDGSTNNRILIYKNTSTPNELRMRAVADNDIKTDQGVDSSGFSGIQKIAFAYKTDDFELYRNGSSISSDTGGSLAALATLTDIDVGQSFADSGQANMWIRAIQIIPRRLSDAQLIELTS